MTDKQSEFSRLSKTLHFMTSHGPSNKNCVKSAMHSQENWLLEKCLYCCMFEDMSIWHNVEVWHLNWYSFFRSNYGVQILSIPKTRLIKKSKIGGKKCLKIWFNYLHALKWVQYPFPKKKWPRFFIFGGSNGANSQIGQKAFKNLRIIASQRRFKRHLLTPVT